MTALLISLAIITIHILPALSGDLKLFKIDNEECSITERTVYLMCPDHDQAKCCFTENKDFCMFLGATELEAGDVIQYYNNIACGAPKLLDTCEAENDGDTCCNSIGEKYLRSGQVLQQCGLNWIKDGDGHDKKTTKKECGTPDLLHYVADDGVARDIFIPRGHDLVVGDLLRAQDWEALAKYRDHNRTQSGKE